MLKFHNCAKQNFYKKMPSSFNLIPKYFLSSKVITVTSGKGGVGKTTTAASFAYGLAENGHKTCVIDFDIGLRNLDIHLGCERRVIFDFVNVLQKGTSWYLFIIETFFYCFFFNKYIRVYYKSSFN